MAENRFKFVSPGIFINEIDNSLLARTPEAIGPVVIGRAQRGPMMRPIKVQDFKEFEEIFGLPVAGGSNIDYWREGGFAAPTYGGFAARAYLKNSTPLTFVRLGGFQNPEADDPAGLAGWEATKVGTGSLEDSGGAYGLFVTPLSSSGVAFSAGFNNATLAAVFYAKAGTIVLSGSSVGGTNTDVNRSGVWVKAVQPLQKTFKISIYNGTDVKTKTISFDKKSKFFIRNVLNTTPSKINSELTEENEVYWLGQTFENTIKNLVGSQFAACIVALEDHSANKNNGGNFRFGAKVAESGWVFAQDKNIAANFDFNVNTNNDFTNVAPQKLFKFVTLSEDEWTQKNIKITIENIKRSKSQFSNFGSFSVVVRKMFDTDSNKQIVERFDECSLDPSSVNYVAKKIGDSYTEWDYINKRFKEYGNFPNASKYIRIIMDADVAAGSADQDLLPFGFYGPKIYRSLQITGAPNQPATLASANSFFSTNIWDGGAGGVSSSAGVLSDVVFSASFRHPDFPIVTSNTAHHLVDNIPAINWGFKTTTLTSVIKNSEVVEFLRPLPPSIANNNSLLRYSTIFSLDDLSGTLNQQNTAFKVAAWAQGNRGLGNSITQQIEDSQGSFAQLGAEAAFDLFLRELGHFTLPLFGGFEGLDITEKEPFNNRADAVLDDEKTVTTSYALNSLDVALDAVSDPDVLEMDLLTIPGIKNRTIHQKMINVCETRADSLAIIDLQGDYDSEFESADSEELRLPDVDGAVSYIKDDLAPNSSYGAAYFPWVQAKDEFTGRDLWVPPSVVALGTMSFTKRNAGVWFAPAGFNRGGLSSDLQPAGLQIINTRTQLNVKERDALYEVGVNPIAKFPAEGVVIFGQKTLQQTASALDRINVRRLMNFVKKEISRFATTVLFDPNVQLTWDRFVNQVKPFLDSVQAGSGITDYRVILDETTTTPELVDRNILYAKIFIKPARAIEFIALDFTITSAGASFND